MKRKEEIKGRLAIIEALLKNQHFLEKSKQETIVCYQQWKIALKWALDILEEEYDEMVSISINSAFKRHLRPLEKLVARVNKTK